MERRELLKMITMVTGSAFIGGEFLLSGCQPKDKSSAGTRFSESDIAFLDEVGETILPATTKSPGAKVTGIGKCMSIIVSDCYDEENQKIFYEGIAKINDASKKMFNIGFVEIIPQQRHELLVSLDRSAREYQQMKEEFDKVQSEKEKNEINKGNLNFRKEKKPSHYFTMMKQLTLCGFFSSKIGSTQVLRHIPVPSKYDGAFPYKYGDKAWAE